MKTLSPILFLFCIVLVSCQDDQLNELRLNEISPDLDLSTSAKSEKIKGPKNRITIDFTNIIDQRAVVTITGTAGEGTFVFDSNDGAIQTGVIPRDSRYDVKWEYYAVTPVECNYMLYWNFTGISIYGTAAYSFAAALDVTLENKAQFTFYKDCGS